jgi:hypothetical protein
MTPAAPPATPSPLPGGLDVGLALHSAWDHVLALSLPFLIVAVVGLVVLACGKGPSARAEWQAWLNGRSATRGDE